VTLGTTGYVLLEGLSVGEAAYLTVLTLTTVGYGDIVPHTTAGRFFTVGLVVSGLGIVLYLATVGAQAVLEGELRNVFGRTAMERRTEGLRDHVIVCGYGRFGRVVAEELRSGGAEVVVIDVDPAREAALRAAGVPYVIGSALADDVLERAGIRRARAVVVATPSDPDNVFITLSAREKSATVRIHARGENDAGLRRLVLAGADQALSAYHSGGVRMAASILRPSIVDFLELSLPGRRDDMALEEVRLAARCTLVGATVVDLERRWPRLRVVALRRREDFRVVPEGTTVLEGDDLLVVIGERGGLSAMAQAAASPVA
jgi:voltage-gated potassium channel